MDVLSEQHDRLVARHHLIETLAKVSVLCRKRIEVAYDSGLIHEGKYRVITAIPFLTHPL